MKKISEVAVVLSAIDKMSKVVKGAVGKSEQYLASFSKRANNYGEKAFKWGGGALASGLMIAAPLLMAVTAAEESAVAIGRLEQVYKSMGETTGQVAKEQAAWASTYQFEIGIEDEKIMLVQSKLATFSKVMSKEARDAGVMNRAVALSFDLQAAGFGEGSGNAVQLGKALQDPIKGIKALAKAGITFTEAEKKKIEQLVKSGHLLEAQNIVLSAVEGQVGGVAKKTVTDSAKIKLAFGEIMEQVGGALLPEIVKLSKFVTGTLMPGFMKWKGNNEGLFSTIVKISGALAVGLVAAGAFAMVFGTIMKAVSAVSTVIKMFSYVTKIATAVQWLMNAAAAANPYVLIAIAIIAIIAAIVAVMVYFDQLYAWFMKQSTGVKILIGVLVLLFAPFLILPILIRTVIKNWGFLTEKFHQFINWFKGIGKFLLVPLMPLIGIPLLIIAYWTQIKSFFVGLWNFVKAVFMTNVAIIMAIPGMIRDRWYAMIAFYRALWENIKGIFLGFVGFIFGIPARMYEAGMNIMNSLWEGIKSTMNKPIDAIMNVTDSIRDFFPFSPAKRGALKDIHKVKLMETVAGSIKPGKVMSAMDTATAAIANKAKANPVLSPLAGISPNNHPTPNKQLDSGQSGPITITFSPHFNSTGTGEGGSFKKEDILAMLKGFEPELIAMVKKALAGNDRKSFI